ncbi:MAG TPA: UvrD-helicase domain-containing protein [Terracidiphilus sp.]|nr:UvrD-helicase domain-containing protein [Terracidiphilus sp.]
MNSSVLPAPPDQAQRIVALDPARSVLVQAPAGSGKTDLLTRRFLRLLAEVDDPKQIVAITFTKAAAAEMRHRILSELEKASSRSESDLSGADFSMHTLANRALNRSNQLGWRLVDLSSQLRISTIDSFCRDLAVQQPIFSGVGNNLEISENPAKLYREAARLTLERLGDPRHPDLSDAITDLLLWRDNGWKELEELLVKMLGQRDRWMHGFVLNREQDWNALRAWLERPFATAVRVALDHLTGLLGAGACDQAHELAKFACEHGASDFRHLAERAEFPSGPYQDSADLEEARGAYLCVAKLLLKDDGEFRKQVNVRLGFPREHLNEKLRLQDLIEQLSDVTGLQEALAAIRILPPARYTDEDWQIIRAIFRLLRHAAGELKAVFAEAGTVDFAEVAQIARRVLRGEDQLPSDAALAVADDIRHLLVDEFQDTSRRQHEFITSLIDAWPDRAGRTIFVVGDPMQSIYFFRDAEAELFRRVKEHGFETGDGGSLPLSPVALKANFRTDPALVAGVNDAFTKVFSEPDGSGITFDSAEAARESIQSGEKRLKLHLAFLERAERGNVADPDSRAQAGAAQTDEIVSLIRSHLPRIGAARVAGAKYRIAVLGRARTALTAIAEALRDAAIPFRAVELEALKERPEILDAVALARALFNREDRIAWLGVLRAPWCGLSLAELHAIAGTDDATGPPVPVPQALRERLGLLPEDSRRRVQRVLNAFSSMDHLRATISTATIGTILQQLWRMLGGDLCVDDTARANLDLFWSLLEKLPEGEQDLVGPALDAALEDLCALPDAETSSDYGVQLMTIHKSKGLEFEVVIVPDLQARSGQPGSDLLSWLERGIAEPDESGELTEFLVAPLQYKGSEPGKAKSWVDRARRERETQEARRILYVAATRAREELHLFAQPLYKTEQDRSLVLVEPSNSLLATAWPAFAEEIQTRFDQWRQVETIIPAIAAAEDNIIVMPSPAKPTILRRLPPEYELASAIEPDRNAESITGLGDGDPYRRHPGGLQSRALGNAVHRLLEELARLRTTLDWGEARRGLEAFHPRITAQVRSAGISLAESIAATAFKIVVNASYDAHGQWILGPHADAASESGWAGVVTGSLKTVRVDRIFRGGPKPLQDGDEALWIIDYKTAHADNADLFVLPELRRVYAPQLQSYAAILRNLHGDSTKLRAGLYYPRMCMFDWWEI